MASTKYTIKQQNFLNSVVDKIGKQEYSDTAYVNPLKRLKRGFIENANDIEEIYVARCVGSSFNPDGTGALDRVKPNVQTQYHQEKTSHQYQVTIQDKEVRQGFHTKGGVTKIANKIMQSMYDGAEYEEFLDFINTVDSLITASKYKEEVKDVTDNATAKEFTKRIKKVVKNMGYRSTKYAIVENHCKPENMILLLNNDTSVEIDVELLASAFNMDKTKLQECTIIEIPELPINKNTLAVLMDERALQIWDTFFACEPMRNGKGHFTNHFLTLEKILSFSNMVNVAVFNKKSSV